MLTPLLLAHAGEPIAPHDLWRSWNADPLLLGGLALAVFLYSQGRIRGAGPRERWRPWCWAGALVALVVALVSPLDALSESLASAHMVQHLLLIVVAAPLMVLSAPTVALWRGVPASLRAETGALHRRVALLHPGRRIAAHPVVVAAVVTGCLWFWHAPGPYGEALDHEVVHVVEHLTFFATALLLWTVVLGARARQRAAAGERVALLVAVAMQGTLLGFLMTFSSSAWYAGYASSTTPWGLDPVADQRLAGVVMWVPSGWVYAAAAVAAVVTWLRESERSAVPGSAPGPVRRLP